MGIKAVILIEQSGSDGGIPTGRSLPIGIFGSEKEATEAAKKAAAANPAAIGFYVENVTKH